MTKKKDIGVCGFGYSGSGAVFDLIKEYEDISCPYNHEFYLTYYPDGLIDLKHNLCDYRARFFNYDVSIKRFLKMTQKYGGLFGWDKKRQKEFFKLSEKLVVNISNTWMGAWSYDFSNMNEIERTIYCRIGNRINRIMGRQIVSNRSMMYMTRDNVDYMICAREYLEQVKLLLGYDLTKNCLFNQPFATNNLEASFPFFDNPYGLIVTRDPRDVYIMVKHFVKQNASWIPYMDVNKFISFYRFQRVGICDEGSNVLLISFEKLIYDYDHTIKMIESFLELHGHSFPQKYFEPEKSVNNTRLFEKYPEYKEDIRKIEKELEDYLFDFSVYPKISNNGLCFWD